MSWFKKSFTGTLLLAAVIALAACGKSEPASGSVGQGPEVDDGVRTISITGNDQMQFNVTTIRAQAGEPIRISFTNIGRMPKQAMGHNWVLFEPMSTAELNAIGNASANNPPEYLPADMSKVIAHTRILGPGEREIIEFDVPSNPGEYPFLCTFPGHPALMRGVLIVE